MNRSYFVEGGAEILGNFGGRGKMSRLGKIENNHLVSFETLGMLVQQCCMYVSITASQCSCSLENKNSGYFLDFGDFRHVSTAVLIVTCTKSQCRSVCVCIEGSRQRWVPRIKDMRQPSRHKHPI